MTVAVDLLTILLFLHLLGRTESSNGSPNHNLSTSCVCPGDTLTYSCTVTGAPGGITVWTGTAFSNCSGNDISLLHNFFTVGSGDSGVCNNGAIVARSIGVKGNNYTSQLTVTVTADISGKTIICVYHDGSSRVNRFETMIPNIDGLGPPGNLHIIAANFASREIAFNWSPVAQDCPSLHYTILSSNCGSCPTTTTNTTVTCTDVPSDGGVCTFAVYTVVCEIPGNLNSRINLYLASASDGKANSVISKECNETIISTAILATLLVLWVVGSTAVNVVILVKLKLKSKNKADNRQTENYEDVSKPERAINTRQNVAYTTTVIK